MLLPLPSLLLLACILATDFDTRGNVFLITLNLLCVEAMVKGSKIKHVLLIVNKWYCQLIYLQTISGTPVTG